MPDDLHPPLHLVAFADGASRGNPGPASYGAVVYDDQGGELRGLGATIGRGTNNVAEYRGAIAAVEAAIELGATELELNMDSQLIVRQIEGRYRVRNAALRPSSARSKTSSTNSMPSRFNTSPANKTPAPMRSPTPPWTVASMTCSKAAGSTMRRQ